MRAMITVVFFGSSGPRKGRGVYKRDVAETKTNYAQQSVGKRALVESIFRSGGVWEGAVGTNGHGVKRMKERSFPHLSAHPDSPLRSHLRFPGSAV